MQVPRIRLSCTYADEFYDCDGNCLNDTDVSGVYDARNQWNGA